MQSSTECTDLEGHPDFGHLRPLVETYVQKRIQDFSLKFARRLNLSWSEQEISKFVRQTLNGDESAVAGVSATPLPVLEPSNLKLSFRHECQSTGCGEGECVLCQYNPDRRCVRNFKTKYLVEDKLRAKCDAPIFVDILTDFDDRAPEPVNLQLQVMALDHAKYDEMTRSGVEVTWDMLTSCMVTWSKGLKKVRVLHKPGLADDDMNITFQCEKNSVSLSELSAMVSSEATLTGHRPQYCLLVSAVDDNGAPLPHVSHAISEPFTVATRRVKSSAKASIPLVHEDVSKLVHMGKATVEKLMNLTEAARAMSVELRLPDHLHHITKVGQFKQLMEMIEGDFNTRKKLMAILKLPADKMEEACQHAASAVVPDSRQRIWISPEQQVGLVYRSRRGAVQFEVVEGVVPEPEEDGSFNVAKMVSWAQVTASGEADSTLMNELQKLRLAASNAWRTPNHPGWMVVGTDEELHGRTAQYNAAAPVDIPHAAPLKRAHSSSLGRPYVAQGSQFQPSSTSPRSQFQPTATSPRGHFLPATSIPDHGDPGSATSPTSNMHEATSNATSQGDGPRLSRQPSETMTLAHSSHSDPMRQSSGTPEPDPSQWVSEYEQHGGSVIAGLPGSERHVASAWRHHGAAEASYHPQHQYPHNSHMHAGVGGARHPAYGGQAVQQELLVPGEAHFFDGSPFESHMSQTHVFQTMVHETNVPAPHNTMSQPHSLSHGQSYGQPHPSAQPLRAPMGSIPAAHSPPTNMAGSPVSWGSDQEPPPRAAKRHAHDSPRMLQLAKEHMPPPRRQAHSQSLQVPPASLIQPMPDATTVMMDKSMSNAPRFLGPMDSSMSMPDMDAPFAGSSRTGTLHKEFNGSLNGWLAIDALRSKRHADEPSHSHEGSMGQQGGRSFVIPHSISLDLLVREHAQANMEDSG